MLFSPSYNISVDHLMGSPYHFNPGFGLGLHGLPGPSDDSQLNEAVDSSQANPDWSLRPLPDLEPVNKAGTGDNFLHQAPRVSNAEFAPVPTPQLPPNLSDPEGERLFQVLWHKIWRVPRYRQYRGAIGSKSGGESKVWPPDREEAFWRACAYYPPRGRETLQHPGVSKKLGHNESIVKYINDTFNLQPNPAGSGKKWPLGDPTPVERRAYGRKKISSKLAVLIPWFKETDSFVYSWLQGDHGRKMSSRPTKKSLAYPGNIRERRARLKASRSRRDHPLDLIENPLKNHICASITSPRSSSEQIEPIDHFSFDMFCNVCDTVDYLGHNCGTSGSDCALKRLHTFTKTVSGCRMPDTYLSTSEFARVFPQTIPANAIRHPECQVVFAEASLTLHPKDLKLDSVSLGIDGKFTTKNELDTSYVWYCRTVFFTGSETHEVPKQILGNINDTSETGVYSHSLPFASKFWVRKLMELDKDWKEAANLEFQNHIGKDEIAEQCPQKENDLKMAKSLRERISVAIKRLSARQEILGYPSPVTNDGIHERLPTTRLVIHWRFRQTGRDEAAITQFRNIILTSSETNTGNPLTSSRNAQLVHEDNEQENLTQAQHLSNGRHKPRDENSLASPPNEQTGLHESSIFSMPKRRSPGPSNTPESINATFPMLNSAETMQPVESKDLLQLPLEAIERRPISRTSFLEHSPLPTPIADQDQNYLSSIQNSRELNRPEKLAVSQFDGFVPFDQGQDSDLSTATTGCFPNSPHHPTLGSCSPPNIHCRDMCGPALHAYPSADFDFRLFHGHFSYKQQVPPQSHYAEYSENNLYLSPPFAPVPDSDQQIYD